MTSFENGLDDESLLERSRVQWQLGDWASLAAITHETLRNHPDRANLAMLAAAGHLQRNSTESAEVLNCMALDWGCSVNSLARFQIAGVYNSLGRAAALCNEQQRALRHYENAISIGMPGSATELIVNARANFELNSLDMLPSSQGHVQQCEILDQTGKEYICRNHRAVTQIPGPIYIDESKLVSESARLPREDFVNAKFDIHKSTATANVLVIFSSPRSGSTLLCDVLRNNHACLAHEYFQPFQYLPVLAKRWDCVRNGELLAEKYIEALCRNRTTQNGWLGINIHGSHIPIFKRFRQYFNGVRFHYLHLVRNDVIGQAISLYYAMQTGIWSSQFQENEQRVKPNYDFKGIQTAVQAISEQNQHVRSYVKTSRIDCPEIDYEELTTNWTEIGKQLATTFESSSPFKFKTDLTVQRGKISETWRDLYHVDMANQEVVGRLGLLEFGAS